VIERITSTAHDAGAAGPDVLYGFGRIDAAAAVTASVPKVKDNPMGSLADWIALYRPAAAAPATDGPHAGARAGRAPDRIVASEPGPLRIASDALPWSVIAAIAAVWAALVVGALATVRRARRTR